MTPKMGMMVVWVVPCGKMRGEFVPAIIVKVRSENRCNLHVFSGDPRFPFDRYMPAIFDPSRKELGSWHFPADDVWARIDKEAK